MDENPAEVSWPALTRARRALVVVDVVESVRLMQAHEADVIDRWRRFVNEVRTQVLPPHGGRLVKSLGDGMLLEFESVPSAVAAALEIQKRIAPYNVAREASAALYLRMGAHVADVTLDELDVYGAGVNLAARLTTLARPGEVVVSPQVRDLCVLGLDAEVEDLGDCYVKHLDAPVHAYRVSACEPALRLPAAEAASRRPVLVVLPFEEADAAPRHLVGELIADGVIAQVSRSDRLHVISRLSSAAFRGRSVDAATLKARLGAHYALSGSFHVSGEAVLVIAELMNLRTGHVVWSERVSGAIQDLLSARSEIVDQLVQGVQTSVVDHELARVMTQPLVTLESYALQLGAVMLMHRTRRDEFDRVRELLEHLIERNARSPTPRAWLAKWYVLRLTRGWAAQDAGDSGRALDQTHRALDLDAECALAWTMEGFVRCHMLKDIDGAARCYASALRSNPNESLAWLFDAVLHTFRGEGDEALHDSEQALRLSPLDPLRYFYDSLAASAAVAAGRYERAIELAQRSIRANRAHSSTYRALAMAQVLGGDAQQARATIDTLLQLEPGYTVSEFLRRSPSAAYEAGTHYAQALRQAGLPS